MDCTFAPQSHSPSHPSPFISSLPKTPPAKGTKYKHKQIITKHLSVAAEVCHGVSHNILTHFSKQLHLKMFIAMGHWSGLRPLASLTVALHVPLWYFPHNIVSTFLVPIPSKTVCLAWHCSRSLCTLIYLNIITQIVPHLGANAFIWFGVGCFGAIGGWSLILPF